MCGRGDRIRTYDPLVPNQMRYQTALRPEVEHSNSKITRANHNAIYFINSVESLTHVKSQLAPYKYPRWVEFVPDLPKTATGKIQRFKLRA